MKSQITVRLATCSDLGFTAQDRYIPEQVVRRKIERGEVVVAEQKGRPVGYARLEYLWSLVPYLALIYVLPDCRREGVGKAILRYIEASLRERGYEALYSSSQVDEAPPQGWHRHMGFEECGIIAGINPGGVGEVFFRKQIR